jgi:hypothetical protein
MGIRIASLTILTILTVLDLGPFPLVSLVGLYIVIFRPAWFRRWVDAIYR